jgi:integrase
MFVWAMGEGLANTNPVIGTNKPGEERSRDRVLRAWEMALIRRATEGGGDFNTIVRLLMLTGQHRDEIAGLRWSELELDRAIWSLPASRTKNRRVHDVPLSNAALDLIASVRQRDGRDLLFGKAEGAFSGWPQSKSRLDRRIAALRAQALGRNEPDRKTEEPWVLHDLRRTLVTGMAEIGVQPRVIEAVVNHVSGHKAGVAGVYNRATSAAEKRRALERWTEHVLALVAGDEASVAPRRQAGY